MELPTRGSFITYRLDDSVDVARIAEADVRRVAEDVLRALGASEAEACVVADGLVTASLWWHPGQGQGLEKLFRYARRVGNGGIVPHVEMHWVMDRGAVGLLDAGKGFGYVSANMAMERAIQKADEHGIAMVGVRHSNHFGIAGYHAKHAADRGMIGIAQTNAGAEMAPWGSATPVLGTNPWGIAVPRGARHDPVVLDMALTQSGKGMMRWLERSGFPMPAHWALTPEGERTDDPGAGRGGPLLPIGDYKGYGLSFMTDVLTGVMTGSLFGRSVFQDDLNYDVGHQMIAIDPTAFLPRGDFEARLEELIAEVTSAPPIVAAEPVALPGEPEQQRARQRRRDGIPVDAETVEGLRALAAELGISFSLDHHT